MDKKVDGEYEVLEGCMCEYIQEKIRTRIEALAETTGVYPSQVVNVALEIGLAVLVVNFPKLLAVDVGNGKIKQKKGRGKLSGAGV